MKKTLLQKDQGTNHVERRGRRQTAFFPKIFHLSTINTAENVKLSTGDALPEMEPGEEVNVEEAQQRSLQ